MACEAPYAERAQMITYKTLEVYQAKCEDALKQIAEAIAAHEAEIELLKMRRIAAQAQLELTESLMDTEANPPISEVPLAGDKIEELHEKRLDMFDDISPEDFYEYRQENVYKKEALEGINAIDAINEEEREEQTGLESS